MMVQSRKRHCAAVLVLACFAIACLPAQTVTKVIPSQPPVFTLDPPAQWEQQAQSFDAKGHSLAPAPAYFRRFGEATMGESGDVHTLTLRFAADTTLTGISSTADFPLQGGTCVKGNTYSRGTACTVLVRFTPQGPGNRLGHLTISHSGAATPDFIGLGGSGVAPVLSFIPSIIATVPGTLASNVGILSSPRGGLATDGGDRLFIADTNNLRVLMIDSSGTIVTYSPSPSQMQPPAGITVDTLGQVWFTAASGGTSTLWELQAPNSLVVFAFGKTDPCTAATPACTLGGETLTTPGELSSDGYGNIFFSENVIGAAMSTVQPTPSLLRLYSAYALNSQRFATDQIDNLYSFNSKNCSIEAQSLNAAEADNPSIYHLVAGTGVCGFSGDGGDARNAEIGASLGQFAFDAAGNLYFTDVVNQRVRRIDASTGIIRTMQP